MDRSRTEPQGGIGAHEHEWEPITDLFPVFEDGAAIFWYECNYVEQSQVGHSKELDESFYRTDYECSETKTVRFDLEEIVLINDDGGGVKIEKSAFDSYEEIFVEVMGELRGRRKNLDPEADELTVEVAENIKAVFQK